MPFTSFAELLAAAEEAGSLAEAAIAREMLDSDIAREEARARMTRSLGVMRDAVRSGLDGTVRSRSGLTGGDAMRVAASDAGPLGARMQKALAYALAVAEVNATMGRIVAAPTGGASGVVPGVLLSVAEEYAIDDDRLVDALFTAGAVGAVIAARATLSGAAGGCQAEIGSAAAMAAAAVTEMLGGTPAQAGHAAGIALQGLLGLVCDPVAGLVEVPCVARNATGAAVALSGAQMALAGVTFAIPFDEVCDAMHHVGRSLPAALRETALGGLAATPSGRRLSAELRTRE